MSGDGKKPSGPSTPGALDDWDSAIDDWEASLDLPNSGGPPPAASTDPDAPSPGASSFGDEPTPVPAAEPLQAPPLAPPPLPAPLAALPTEGPDDDPLLHLFDGEMQLPDVPGEALGALLGEEGGEAQAAPAEQEPASLPEELGDLGLDFDDQPTEDPRHGPPRGSTTPVQQARERQKLVELAHVEDVATFDDAGEEGLPVMVPPAATAGYDEDSEVDLEVVSEPAEGATTEQPARRSSRPPPPRPRATPEALERLRRQLLAAEQESEQDDAYDDIQIERGPGEPESPLAAAVERAVEQAPPKPKAGPGEVTLLMQPPADLAQAVARAAEASAADDPFAPVDPFAVLPDPLAQRAPEAAPPPTLAPEPAGPIEEDESGPLVAAPRASFGALGLAVPEQADPRPPAPDELKAQVALLDGERMQRTDPAEVAELAYGAGRAAERVGELAQARDRYESALEVAPGHAMALRGLRRVALAERRVEDALGLLEREVAIAAPAERAGLAAQRAELALAAGERALAATLHRAALDERADDLRAASGLCDALAGDAPPGDAAALRAATAALEVQVRPAPLQAALRVALGRSAELAGKDGEAATLYRAALDRDAGSSAAALGLWRVALRGPRGEELAAAEARLAPLTGGAMRGAVERRRAAFLLEAGDAAGAAAALAGAEDYAALELRARAEAAAGQTAQAAATLEALATALPASSTELRGEILIELGELHERSSAPEPAQAAWARAAADLPGDAAVALAVERVEAERGDREQAIARARARAAADPGAAEAMRLAAARALIELGRSDEAAGELDAQLTAQPTSLATLEERVELALAGGRPAEAARALAQAARAHEAAGDALQATLLGDRAARLHARSGDIDGAVAEASRLLDGDLGLSARWLIERLLGALPDRAAAFADALGAEAETAVEPARAAALWHARGLALEASDAEAAADAQRRALQLVPSHAPALLALALKLGRSGQLGELAAPLRARIEAAGQRPEASAHLLRLGALQEEAGEPAAAAQSFSEALERIPAQDRWNPPAKLIEELYAGAARRAGDLARAVDLAGQLAEGEPDPEERFAREVELAEWCELHLGRIDAAGEHYHRALELRPGSPLALAGLQRAFKAGGRFAVLAEMALHDLREAPDVARRVAAYEQLAILDGEHRGDPQSALLSYEAILRIDAAHQPSYRVLEKHYLKEQRWLELIALYDQMGLAAADPSLASAVILDRARLRERIGSQDGNVDNDYRQALFKDGRCAPALRRMLAAARYSRDPMLSAELCLRLAEAPETEPRAAAIFLCRAAEAYTEVGRGEDALARYRDALHRDPQHLPAMRAMARFGVEQLAYAAALAGAEAAGGQLREPTEKARAWLIAGALASERLFDTGRALIAFRQVLALDPGNKEAFDRVRALLGESGDHKSLAEALEGRVAVERDPRVRERLHLELAALDRDHLGDRERARHHLREVLAGDGNHLAALEQLSALHFEDQQWTEAADVLIRRARLEKRTAQLKEIYFQLGTIYADHVPDVKRALVSFTRVLQIEPTNPVALSRLSDLYLAGPIDWKGALGATVRLADLESDPIKKVADLHRIARIQEEGFKDPRAAHHALQRALEVDPRYLPAIGELAKFYDRQSDQTSARVHLDRSANAMRLLLQKVPNDLAPYHALFRIFQWRRSWDQAFTVANLLSSLGASDEEEDALLTRFGNRPGAPGAALGDPALDEQLFHPSIPPGFRNMFRLLDEPLQKVFRGDVRRLGLGKQDRLPRSGHPVRDVANRLATELGVRDFDLYVTAAAPTLVAVELTEPIAIVIGSRLVEGAHESEVLFHVGGVLRMLRSHMAVPLRMNVDELGILVGAIVRQFVPDFVPNGLDERAIVVEAGRLGKVIPRKLHQEILPFALECADAALDLRSLAAAIGFTTQRAGVLAAGSIARALTAVRKRGDEASVRELMRFAISDELAELRRIVGTAVVG